MKSFAKSGGPYTKTCMPSGRKMRKSYSTKELLENVIGELPKRENGKASLTGGLIKS
jgi:hypothetical protein